MVTALNRLARVVDALGNFLGAARIWRTAERQREEIGTPLSPNVQARLERRVAAARAAVADERRSTKLGAKDMLYVEQMVEFALRRRSTGDDECVRLLHL